MVTAAPTGVIACCLHVQFAISVCQCAPALPLSVVLVRCRLQCSRRGPRSARCWHQSWLWLPGGCALYESPQDGCVGQTRTQWILLRSSSTDVAQGARCWPNFGVTWWATLFVVLVVVVVLLMSAAGRRQDPDSWTLCVCGLLLLESCLVRRGLPARVAAGHRQSLKAVVAAAVAAACCGARSQSFRALPV